MEQLLIDLIEQCGYLAIIFLLILENLFPPLPSELILIFCCYLTTISELTIIGVILAATFGSLIGALILYHIGSIICINHLKRLFNTKLGKITRIKEKDIDNAFDWFEKRGNIAILICKFIPVLRSLISIPAGMSKMNLNKFIIYTTLGSLMWNISVVLIGIIFFT